MRQTRRNAIISFLIANGAALVLTLLVLSPLAAASNSAQVNNLLGRTYLNVVGSAEPTVQLPGQPATITPTVEVSTPTTILELFFSSADAPPGADQISGDEVEVFSAAAAGAGELGAAAVGLPLFSDSPVFSSEEMPDGTFSMDWGDMDHDGDLDLAVGSTHGTIVYKNEGGQLGKLWQNDYPALLVRWADVHTDWFPLELIAVGSSSDGTPQGTTVDYIYLDPQSTSTSAELSYTTGWSSPLPPQLLRVEPGDYNNDDFMDVVVSTNALNPPSGICPVLLYLNDGYTYPYDNYDLYCCGTDPPTPSCVSDEATASLAPADFDNDGDLDLAVGLHQSKKIRIIKNQGTSPWLSPSTDYVDVASSLAHIPYDLAWGDYDHDGDLDLAAAFPLEQEVRIYRNQGGPGFEFTQTLVISTSSFLTPLAVDWADFDNDGRLELAVADLPPKVYQYDGAGFIPLAWPPAYTGRIQDIRGIDLDDDTDLDLALANQYTRSLVFETQASPLSPTLTIVTGTAQSVAWGDAGGDGFLDLLFDDSLYTYNSSTGNFEWEVEMEPGGLAGAFGDFDGDFDLDIASGCQIYSNSAWAQVPLPSCSGVPESLAWGDYNGDGYLDLAVADDTHVRVYRNHQGNTFTQVWAASGTAWSVAWADYDHDYYLDLAVASGDQVQVYRHDYQDDTFIPLSSALPGNDARSLVWVDYNGDGWMDLSVGDHASANYIYENQNGSLSTTPISISTQISKTTSLAWGDWDNDGDLDLAVGNDGEKDQVYENIGGNLSTNPAWESTEIYATTGVAWGDKDGDGDLDLSVSSENGSGVYENNIMLPAHVGTQYRPLPRNPSYLSVARPGATEDAYFLSSGEVHGQQSSTVPITYTLYDPEGDSISGDKTVYRFSLNGGSTWIPAANVTLLSDNSTASPTGNEVTLTWDPQADMAGVDNPISDNALFQVSIVHQKPAGPVQRASASAVSPPFRVRAVTCIWPSGPSIQILDPPPPEKPQVGELTKFLGNVEEGTGLLRFTWDFGDSTFTVTAQLVNHLYTTPGTYTVTLTASGEPCPVTREVVTKTTVEVCGATSSGLDGSRGPYGVYLPLVLKSGADMLPQVTGLQGSVDPESGTTRLAWGPVQATDSILGYRVYRGSRAAPDGDFQLLATLPAYARSYTDRSAACGHMYYVTAFNASGESLPSTASYFSPPCR